MTSETAVPRWPSDPADLINPDDDWVGYKFRAADWYVDALRSLHDDNGVNRLFGVEMALDGAFSQLNGAFDAAVFELITAAEDAYPSALERSEEHRRDAQRLQQRTLPQLAIAGFLSPEPQLPTDLAAALSQASPLGWLQEFRRARNTTMHNKTLPRHTELHIDDRPGEAGLITAQAASKIEIGLRPVHAIQYLESSRNQIKGLTDRIRRVQKSLPL